jgi:hypothetical protein
MFRSKVRIPLINGAREHAILVISARASPTFG